MIRTAMIGIVFMFLLTGCVGLMEPCSYQLQPYQGIAKPPTGEAVVVFYFPGLREMAFGYPVYENKEIIGAIRGSSYFYRTIKPGLHTFMVDRMTPDYSELIVNLNAEKGETYYIQFMPLGGTFDHPMLSVVPETVAMKQLPFLGWMQLNGDPKLIGVVTKEMLARQERGVH